MCSLRKATVPCHHGLLNWRNSSAPGNGWTRWLAKSPFKNMPTEVSSVRMWTRANAFLVRSLPFRLFRRLLFGSRTSGAGGSSRPSCKPAMLLFSGAMPEICGSMKFSSARQPPTKMRPPGTGYRLHFAMSIRTAFGPDVVMGLPLPVGRGACRPPRPCSFCALRSASP
jgi:hypothetical protein